MDVVFLDFSKAFDTVPHRVILDTLLSCEMSRVTMCWLKNCVNGRIPRSVVNGATSG